MVLAKKHAPGWMSLVAIAVSGCASRSTIDGQPPTVIAIQPVIVTAGGHPAMAFASGDMSWILAANEHLAASGAPYRVALREPVYIEQPEWLDADEAVRDAMRLQATARYQADGVVSVYCVAAVHDGDCDAARYVVAKAWLRGPMVVTTTTSAYALMHELLHVLGLLDIAGDDMCTTWRRCNAMSYCPGHLRVDCSGYTLTAAQIRRLRLP